MNCDFCADENQLTTSVADLTVLFQNALAKHFWFQESELLALQICGVCSKTVMGFHLFYSNVERLHAAKCAEQVEPNGDVLVKDEPPQPESIEDNALDRKELIVGDVAFEIVEVGSIKQDIPEESILPDEVKQEAEEPVVEPLEPLESDNNNELDNSSQSDNFSCRNCKKSFEDKMILTLHRRIVHGNQKVYRTCKKCTAVGEALKGVLGQDQTEVSEHSGQMQCTVCDGWLLNTSSLQRHLVWHWTEKCTKCKKRPQDAEAIEPYQTLTCPECDKTFEHINFLKLHIKHVHGNLATPKCIKCSNLEQALKDISDQNQTESGRIKCTVCDGWLMNVASLQRHLVWHQSEPCDVCGKRPQHAEAAVKQHVQTQKVSTAKRLTIAAPQPKKAKVDEAVTMQHVCAYCGLYFDVFAGLIKHQVDEHPGKKHRKYTSIVPNKGC